MRSKSRHKDLRLRVSRQPEERASTSWESICFKAKFAAKAHASFRFLDLSFLPQLTNQAHVRCAPWQEAVRPSRSASERTNRVRKRNSNAIAGMNDRPRRNVYRRRASR